MKLLEKTLSLIGYEKRAVNGDGYWSDFAALRGATITPATISAGTCPLVGLRQGGTAI